MYLPKAIAFQPLEQVGIIEVVLQWLTGVWNQLREPLGNLYKAFLELIVHAAQVINEPLKQHPHISLFISFLVFLGPWILLLPLFLLQATFFVLLYILGFGLSGIIGGSPAALYQSFCYGGHTPSASLFAMLQSAGTQYNVGTVSNGVLVTIRVLAGVVGLYVLFGIILV